MNFLNFVPEGSLGLEFPYDSSLEGFIGETNIEKEDEKENAKEDENDSVEGLLALHLDGQWLSPPPRLTASQKVHLPFDKLTVLSKVEGLTALSKAEGLRALHPSSLQRTSLYASFLRICAPYIWIFFLCRLISTFYNDIKTADSRERFNPSLPSGETSPSPP
jgi:hypothetical protein